jgi:hypothetical protein
MKKKLWSGLEVSKKNKRSSLVKEIQTVLTLSWPDCYTDTWMPAEMRQTEYLEVDLGHPTPIFGLEMRGSPEAGAYISSFILLHSDDGHMYSYILDHEKKNQVS